MLAGRMKLLTWYRNLGTHVARSSVGICDLRTHGGMFLMSLWRCCSKPWSPMVHGILSHLMYGRRKQRCCTLINDLRKRNGSVPSTKALRSAPCLPMWPCRSFLTTHLDGCSGHNIHSASDEDDFSCILWPELQKVCRTGGCCPCSNRQRTKPKPENSAEG